MSRQALLTLTALVVCLAWLPSASAFGSGNIPDAAYLKGKAWRHGEIEDTLESLAKIAGDSGGAILGAIAGALLGGNHGSGGKRFSGLDIKRVYFGNWLRDLSQVCDIAGFKAMTAESLVIVIMTLGFMSFGYATGEFEVTKDRLSVYSLSEHLDNPKGYGEGEDPRTYDSRLRPPVEDRELEIDQRNGMKKYLATEGEGFETGTATIRRFLKRAIELCREGRRENDKDKEYEAYRLLGTGLHTLEDFSAHSNWCELALRKLGHKEVFPHVGDNVKVRSPSGEEVSPLVTGTFGGADFMHSMLGEAGDKLSQSSIADLTQKMDDAQAKNQQGGKLEFLKGLLAQMPSGGGDNAAKLDEIEQKKKGFDLDGSIDQIAPEELQKQLWQIFKIRDDIFRNIEETIESIPGLSQLLENISTSLMEFVLVNIDPFVRPLLIQATTVIGEGSKAVISGTDQWTDHFSNILNDPAGNISVIVVKHTVELIVEAWGNDSNPDEVINRVLEAIHHPDFASGNSQVQRDMMDYMQNWLREMDDDDRQKTLDSLTKDGVRNHRNQRKTSESDEDPRVVGGQPHSHGAPAQQQQNRPQQEQSSYAPSYPAQQTFGSGRQEQSNFGRQQNEPSASSNYGRQSNEPTTTYNRQQNEPSAPSNYGRQSNEPSGYGREQSESTSGYGRQSNAPAYGREEQTSYQPSYGQDRPQHESRFEGGRQDDEPRHGGRSNFDSGRERADEPSYGRQSDEPTYGREQASHQPSYGQDRPQHESRFDGGRQDDEPRRGGRSDFDSGRERDNQPSYGQREEPERSFGAQGGYGGNDGRQEGFGERRSEGFGGGGQSFGGRQEHESGGHGRQDNDAPRHHGRRSSRGGDDDDDERRGGGRREQNRYD